jgi:hypothetical protein
MDNNIQGNRLHAFLAFGMESVLPTELEYGLPRTEAYNDEHGTIDAQLSVDLPDEARDVVVICFAKYQEDLRCYHD